MPLLLTVPHCAQRHLALQASHLSPSLVVLLVWYQGVAGALGQGASRALKGLAVNAFEPFLTCEFACAKLRYLLPVVNTVLFAQATVTS